MCPNWTLPPDIEVEFSESLLKAKTTPLFRGEDCLGSLQDAVCTQNEATELGGAAAGPPLQPSQQRLADLYINFY